MHPHEQRLRNAGYITKRFTEYHFQVKKAGGKDIVNVWPTAHKILRKFSPGPAARYHDILEAVKPLLEPKSMKEQLRLLYPLPKPNELFDYYQENYWALIRNPELLKEYLEVL